MVKKDDDTDDEAHTEMAVDPEASAVGMLQNLMELRAKANEKADDEDAKKTLQLHEAKIATFIESTKQEGYKPLRRTRKPTHAPYSANKSGNGIDDEDDTAENKAATDARVGNFRKQIQ